MIFDIPYKLFRKGLPQFVYDFLSYRAFGRQLKYEKTQTYIEIFNHYSKNGIPFKGKRILEIGSGKQYYTALLMLNAGAEHVTIVEPKITFNERIFLNQLDELRRAEPTLCNISNHKDILRKISHYPLTSNIPVSLHSTYDSACSFTVLEHVEDLPSLFSDIFGLIKPNGVSYHLVDLSDHTYQFLARFDKVQKIIGRRALFHLRYPNWLFDFLNDRKCYMNRKLFPHYASYATQAGFTISTIRPTPFQIISSIHKDVIESLGEYNPETLLWTNFGIKLTKQS